MEVPPLSLSTSSPTPLTSAPPDFNSDPAWKLPGWFEPVVVACILFGACYFTRRRRYSVFGHARKRISILDDDSVSSRNALLSGSDTELSSRESSDGEDEDSYYSDISTLKNPPKRRSCCGITFWTPDTSRFKDNWHSRVLHKFPFLLEMFYWVITYLIYRLTHIFAQLYFEKSIWDVAQTNGLRILAFEQFSPFRFAFPVMEIQVQNWFLQNHPLFLTILNKFYALIHIPGSVYFMAWYYYAAPRHAIFAKVRRTVTLCNLLAFVVFTMYPCMPPRLLPKEYGFIDTVRRDSAESVWMAGKFVNHLAAMPSMHFGYSFMIGVTCLYHAGAFRWLGCGYENKSSKGLRIALGVFGAMYPLALLITIVATANHYYMDVIVAIFVATFSLLCNRVFMVFVPLEDLLFWCLRAERPKHNTGVGFKR